MRKLFGTDGIRGRANADPMTPQTVLTLAMAAARHFTRNGANGKVRPTVVIGKDTRLSGYMLEPALTAGFTAMGMDAVLLGPLPTPAVAMLTRSLRAELGVMISASHNPYYDNGIKLFGPDGFKLSDAVEAEIEADMAAMSVADVEALGLAGSAALGRARRMDDAVGRYVEFAKATFPRGLRLDGLKIVVDCANGAAYRAAPSVLWELGAEVVSIGVTPNGTNINADCGATATNAMRDQVVASGADLGIALDGDADRLILADETGQRIDGDQLMALIASSWADSGRLTGGGLVATVMSNMGLERCLAARGLTLARTPVGDRYVLEHMRANGFNIGGEQSGHMILSDYATTGDGLIAALQVLAVLVASERPASEGTNLFEPMPQCLKNVRFSAETTPLETPRVKDAIRSGESALNGSGRLLIRKSGTEPVIRVMAEGEDEGLILRIVDDIVHAIETAAA